MNALCCRRASLSLLLTLSLWLVSPPSAAPAVPAECRSGEVWTPETQKGTFGQDLAITATVCLGAGKYAYNFVNIHSGGKLVFLDAPIDFWARSIVVENGGSLLAGTPAAPIGTENPQNVLTIHLYGADSGPGIGCKTPRCGVPADWTSQTKQRMPAPEGTPPEKIVQDYFYPYGNLPTYPAGTGGIKEGDYPFGRKVLAAAYGGTVRLFGKKGATYADVGKTAILKGAVRKGSTRLELNRFVDWQPGEKLLIFDMTNPAAPSEVLTIQKLESDPVDLHAVITLAGAGLKRDYLDPGNYRVMEMDASGSSWVRLDASVKPGDQRLVLDRVVDWQPGDEIVLTATDYLPGHSEKLSIKTIAVDREKKNATVTVNEKIAYPHNGNRFPVPKAAMPDRIRDKVADAVETRAAVALLSRNIRVVSAGEGIDQKLADDSYFGGHTIVRQGVKQYQVQGVEFYQLGQGGRMAHSPVNFHLVRQAPPGTFVADCSAWDTMTRWYEIRGTQGVMLNRNVGYKSIGHGFFLAEGTEAMNLLQANIGIYARPAIDYPDNPRKVPGIIAKAGGFNADFPCPKSDPPATCHDPRKGQYLAYGGDYIHPSVFFIMNGYNNFENNMAVGAGACGACYWFAPAVHSGYSRNQSWEGYAGIQRQTAGRAPIKSFHGNFCSTAQHSLITIDTTGVCKGVNTPDQPDDPQAFRAVPNPFAGFYDIADQHDPKRELYPEIQSGATLQPIACDLEKNPGCQEEAFLCTKGNTRDCAVSVIDGYTSSFHWAQQNFAAIWLRTNWFLFTDSALTDVLNGGLTMVSGGSWDQVMNQYWALTRNSVFVGHTQGDNPYATNAGPVNPRSSLTCSDATPASYCRLQEGAGKKDTGVVIPIDNFSVYQRLYNIYDGPVYQESNAYLQIKKATIGGCDNPKTPGECGDNRYLYWRAQGIPRAKEDPYRGQCILPNAAIGWKQPNGFYYPPAFHSRNLFFNDVDIRHFIIVPLFKPGTSEVDVAKVKAEYCTYPPDGRDGDRIVSVNAQYLFADNFTDVDRQTELSDDDGSLSGLRGAAPRQIGAGADDAGGTIAVNRDQYFDAPRQTLECLSEQTCLQSPYDYLTAVVIPGCAMESFGGCNEQWRDVCENRDCYGVPIYRQYLNDGEAAGGGQSIRMMGTGIAQRSTLVANNGRYYIDTAVSAARQLKQENPPLPAASRNVFVKGERYNFFFLYAKPTSRVTLQLYVGKGLADTYRDSHVKLIRVGTAKEDGVVLRTTPLVATPGAWPAAWKKTYSPESGILEVTVDLTGEDFKKSFADGVRESCGPPSFCKWQENTGGGGGACVYQGAQKVIDYRGEDAICQWSVKAAECPSGGCYGFQVELAADVADDGLHRPAPAPFPPDFSVAWKTASGDMARDLAVSEKAESNAIGKISQDDFKGAKRTKITLGSDIQCENCAYQLVRRIDAAATVTGWAWLQKGTVLRRGDRELLLDRAVDWQPGEKITLATPGACVYPADNASPTPAYLWDVADPQ